MTTHPTPLQLADWLDQYGDKGDQAVADDLRRLHAENERLREALLEAITEYAGLPHSLGYSFTHINRWRGLIRAEYKKRGGE